MRICFLAMVFAVNSVLAATEPNVQIVMTTKLALSEYPDFLPTFAGTKIPADYPSTASASPLSR